MTIDHAHNHALTVQGNQAARARAITLLTETHDLPTVSTWSISDNNDYLAGLIFASVDDHDSSRQREALLVWAAFLESDVTERRVKDGRIELSCEGRAYGVPVRIWARLRPDRHLEVA